jgi:hypothetical protein
VASVSPSAAALDSRDAARDGRRHQAISREEPPGYAPAHGASRRRRGPSRVPHAARDQGVAADGKLYFADEEGEVVVVKPGPSFEVLARNELGEACLATPALARGALYFRTRGHLIAIGAPKR